MIPFQTPPHPAPLFDSAALDPSPAAEQFGLKHFDPEQFDPELTAEGLTAERLRVESLVASKRKDREGVKVLVRCSV